jgi:hypothetical protein
MRTFWFGVPYECMGGPADGTFFDLVTAPKVGDVKWGWWRDKKVFYRFDGQKFRYMAAVTYHGGPGNGGVEVTDNKDAA